MPGARLSSLSLQSLGKSYAGAELVKAKFRENADAVVNIRSS